MQIWMAYFVDYYVYWIIGYDEIKNIHLNASGHLHFLTKFSDNVCSWDNILRIPEIFYRLNRHLFYFCTSKNIQNDGRGSRKLHITCSTNTIVYNSSIPKLPSTCIKYDRPSHNWPCTLFDFYARNLNNYLYQFNEILSCL